MSETPATTESPAVALGTTVHEVHWRDALPWWILFRAAGLAFSPSVILLAALGGLATWAGWSLCDSLGLAAASDLARDASADTALTVPSVRALPNARQVLAMTPPPISDAARLAAAPFDPAATLGDAASSAVRLAWFVLVWSVFGTAITRHAALKLVGEEPPGLVGGLRYGAAMWPAGFNAVAFVVLGIVALSIPGAILGLVMRADWGLAVAGILWPLVLAGALVLAILVIGLMAGWPLMLAAIGVERGDSFQAISTAFSYLYQRPLHYAFYAVVAAVVFVPALFAAGIFADATTSLALWATSFGMGHARTAELLQASTAALGGTADAAPGFGLRALLFWSDCMETLLGSFGWGYFWAVMTAAYLLLRRDVDGTELDEVVLEELPGEAPA